MNLNTKIVCADGFSMSVQAHQNAYCSPRIDGAPRYTEAEIGFPSAAEDLLAEYAETPSRPTDTVYAWVPASVITLVVAKHGGIVTGELPAGIPFLRAQPEDSEV
jgi:hypothetical protein|tara:strand:- start:1607 stop:1921 length:315 start_codon:yes stop_codon:yes gene_type:complete